MGESVLQKVLRHALSSKFVIVKNTEPSGHLYEIPHVAKMAECCTAVLQETGRGATWMFEDAFFRHAHWQRFEYPPAAIEKAVRQACSWAEEKRSAFAAHQSKILPWMKK